MSKHTPGPWRSQGNIIFAGSPGEHVAKLYDLPRNPGESRALEQGANARLISAAPELLEALKLWVEMFTAVEKPNTEGADVLAQSRAAIAKAEGKYGE